MTAWYKKDSLTFSDMLVAVRVNIWTYNQLSTLTLKPKINNCLPTI